MISQQIAKTSEFSLAGVLSTKAEGLVSGRLVHLLQPGIVTQDFEDCSVGFPEELEPGGNDSTVSSVFALFGGDCGQHHAFRGLRGLEVVDGVEELLLGLCLCFSDFGFSKLDEAFEHQLWGNV